ncbi:type VI secretion system Vgr family protein [Sorangium sp. So ce128]|uniref:type VI secretion system Vgr family protein n=1 Tax=Sorangium sp. So ce128 TaxID=3133281 RepID=UPI003F632C4F
MADGAIEFDFAVEGATDPWRVARIEGHEGISRLFHFRVTLASTDAALAFDGLVGQTCLLTIRNDASTRYIHGIVARFEQHEEGRSVTTYLATVVPRAWRLQHRHDYRIFQEATAPEIIDKVLRAAGLSSDDFRISTAMTHDRREYSVQYAETDWAFISRLMEETGMFCFFEHKADNHVLVFGDAPFVHEPIDEPGVVPYRAVGGALAAREAVSRFSMAEEVRPGKVTVRDYNFQKPSLSLEGEAEADRDTDLEVYVYATEHDLPEEGTQLAKLRLEQLQLVRRTAEGQGSVLRFMPGATFTLEDHGRESFNRGYLITRVDHFGSRAVGGESQETVVGYSNRFQCIPDDVPYRTPVQTPKPTPRGIQTAIVVGPAGEEIHTDIYGRVKVQFHWDRKGRRNEQSSCWMRVSQIWAGAAWGSMYIPRIGHEVVIDFLEGDPDRPLIVGRVYHGANVPPYALPAEKTKSTIKSDTSPGGGGSNELRFEDRRGAEEIYLHAQKDWNIEVENDKTQSVGHDERLTVGHDRKKRIDNSQWESIGAFKTTEVGEDHNEKIGANRTLGVVKSESVDIGEDASLKIGQGRKTDVGKDDIESVGGKRELSVGGEETVKVGDRATLEVGSKRNTTIGADDSLSVGGTETRNIDVDATESVGAKKTVKVGEKFTLECGSGKIIVDSSGKITVEGSDITVKGSGTVKVEGAKVEVKSDGDVSVKAGSNIKLSGSGVDIN